MTFSRGSGYTGGNFRWVFLTPGQKKQWHKVGDGSASSVVMAPILWIGRNFPEAPPALWKKSGDSGEEERVVGKGENGGDHNLIELLARPNQFYSGSTLWTATVMDYHLSGDAYWLKIRDRGGRPAELWWTYSGLMKPCGDESHFITHYEYRPMGTQSTDYIEIPPSEVVHFRYGIDPENNKKGRSPLSSLLHEVFTDSEANDFVASLLGNMGVPGVVVSPKGDHTPTADDVTATKDFMNESFSGEKRGKPLVMSGPTTVAQFGFSPEQLNLRDIRRIPEERVTACVGVPAIVAGLGAGLDRSTFTNYGEARTAAYEDNIIPAQRSLSEDIHLQLLPDFEPTDFFSFRFGFDLANVRALQEDRNALADRFDTGIRGGWIRVGEGRRALDLEVDDTDDVYLRNVTVVEVPAGEPMAAPGSPAALSPGQPAQPALPPGQEDTAPGQSGGDKPLVKASRMQSQLLRALVRDEQELVGQFAKDLHDNFVSFGQMCADLYLSMQHETASNGNGTGHHFKEADPGVMARLIVASLNTHFDDTLLRSYDKATKRVIDKTVETLGLVANLTGGVSDEAQHRILSAGGTRRGLIDINNNTINSIFTSINEGNVLGSNPREIARSIRDNVPSGRYVNAGPTYRSQLIARTETRWAQNSSCLSYYRESEEVQKVIALDGSDDPECAERNGQEFTIDEAESAMEDEHPNGTLTFAPIVSESTSVPA